MSRATYICGPTGNNGQCAPVSMFDSFELANVAARKKKLPPTHIHRRADGTNEGPAWGPASDCKRAAAS